MFYHPGTCVRLYVPRHFFRKICRKSKPSADFCSPAILIFTLVTSWVGSCLKMGEVPNHIWKTYASYKIFISVIKKWYDERVQCDYSWSWGEANAYVSTVAQGWPYTTLATQKSIEQYISAQFTVTGCGKPIQSILSSSNMKILVWVS